MVRDWMDRRAMARSGRDGSAFTENAVGYGRKVIHSARYTSAARLGQVRMAARNFATVVGQLTQRRIGPSWPHASPISAVPIHS